MRDPTGPRGSFRWRLARSSLGLLVASLSVTVIITCLVARSTVLTGYEGVLGDAMEEAMGRAQVLLQEIARTLDTIAASTELGDVLRKTVGDTGDATLRRWTLESYLGSHVAEYEYIDSILLVHGEELYIGMQSSLLGILRVDRAELDALKESMGGPPGDGAGRTWFARLDLAGTTRFSLVRELDGPAPGGDRLAIALNERFGSRIQFPGAHTWLTDGESDLTLSDEPGARPGAGPGVSGAPRAAPGGYELRGSLGWPGSWTVVNVVDTRAIQDAFVRMLAVLVLVSLACTLLAVPCSLWFSRRLALPLRSLDRHIGGLIERGFPENEIWRLGGEREGKAPRLGFRARVFLYFFVLVMLPVAAVTAAGYRLSVDMVRQHIGSEVEGRVRRAAYQADFLCAQYDRSTRNLSLDASLQACLRDRVEGRGDTVCGGKLAESLIRRSPHYLADTLDLRVYDEAMRGVLSLVPAGDATPPAAELRTIRAADPAKVWSGVLTDELGREVVRIGMRVRSTVDARPLGYLVHDLGAATLSAALREVAASSRAAMVVTDRTGAVVLRSGDIIGGPPAAGEGGDAWRFRETLEAPGWVVEATVPAAEYLRANTRIFLVNGLLLLAYGTGILLTSLRFSNTALRRVRELAATMHGDPEQMRPVGAGPRSGDEIHHLELSFNAMVERIQTLIREVYRAQIDRSALDLRLKDAQLSALQAQINPHFLYNALETIHFMIVMRDERAVTMVQLLGDLFRAGIGKGRRYITIAQEIEHVELYFRIQCIRYTGRFAYRIEVPEGVRRLYTIAFLLQPIVENAIYHGLEIREQGGLVRIQGDTQGDQVRLRISDNGCGMDEAELAKVYDALEGRAGGAHVGMRNVHERLRLHFGDAYGAAIQSEPGEGTVVTLTLPVLPRPPDGV